MAKSQALTGIYLPVYFARPNLIRKGLEDMVEESVSGAVHKEERVCTYWQISTCFRGEPSSASLSDKE